MKTKKQLGIWMDYSIAHVMELKGDSWITTDVESDFTWEEKQHSFFKNEGSMHKKEQRFVIDYFKKIMKQMTGFDDVILFGAGDAKTEFFNYLNSDPAFSKIKINVETANKMTENQRIAFLKNYFHTTYASIIL